MSFRGLQMFNVPADNLKELHGVDVEVLKEPLHTDFYRRLQMNPHRDRKHKEEQFHQKQYRKQP